MTVDQIRRDLLAEGAPEAEFVPGVAATFARKRISAAALIRDPQGRVMLLDQPYRPTWGLPGGVLEDDEPPAAGLRRELIEELGTDLPVGRLLAVDWIPRHGAWTDSLQFLFDCGVLDDDAVAGLTLQAEEISELRFVPLAEVGDYAKASVARRLVAGVAALEAGVTTELEFGRPR